MRGNGFTLAEMLVGLIIFGLLAAAGTGLLAGATNTAASSRIRLDDVAALARTRLLLAADLAQAAPRPWRDERGARQPAFMGNASGFTMVRAGWVNPGNQPRAGLQRLGWALAGTQVQRRAAAMLDGAPPGDAASLLAVRSARWRYHGAQGWRDDWPGPGLPDAVQLDLLLPQGPARLLLPVAQVVAP